ncbi:MAG: prohibitin family protein [Woronichinia naegeliana WA131]|uniref:Prohibitin family protein n=1 Tax=Woronichinia naegeliana WA131 TaxID=2824559 RepID=A0A977PUR4_9CYAN|nr:MAG: prohibitin family protein [Woronichinia naegeliana WA131]
MTLLILAIISTFFVVIPAGKRGVLMEFGQVKEVILAEGLHPLIPVVNTVEKLSVRVQKQEIIVQAACQDLQNISLEVALNWHLDANKIYLIFQQIGNQNQIIDKIINPSLSEVIKSVTAQYTAEEMITQRSQVKTEVDTKLRDRLKIYHILMDDLSFLNIHFSDRFQEAVEAKQIAEQEARRAGFIAQKALKKAEAKVNLAKGEAEANRLIQASLTPEILQRQTLKKWNGHLPLIVDSGSQKILDINELIKYSQYSQSY